MYERKILDIGVIPQTSISNPETTASNEISVKMGADALKLANLGSVLDKRDHIETAPLPDGVYGHAWRALG